MRLTSAVAAGPATLFERDTGGFRVRLLRYPANLAMSVHAHDEDGISVLIEGSVVEEAHHTSVTARAGWAVIKPAGTVHENVFGPEGATLLALEPRTTFARALPLRWSWLESARVFQCALRLVKPRRDGARAEEDDLTELVASLAGPRREASRAPWLQKIKRTLDDLDQSPPSVAALAADADVHPVYLARCFRAAFGLSIREYRKIAQVRRAIAHVVGTRRPLSEIAHGCGFADHSHMCRSFAAVANITPRDLRSS